MEKHWPLDYPKSADQRLFIELRGYAGSTLFSMDAHAKKVSEYDQEIPQSQTADNPTAPRGVSTQPSRDTRKTN